MVGKKITDNAKIKTFMIKDGRLKIKSLCTICGNKKIKYISKWSGNFLLNSSSLDHLVINYKHEQRAQ